MRTWSAVSHPNPCLICHKPDWCRVSQDNTWAICRRLDPGEGLHRIDRAGGEYWLYHLDGSLAKSYQVTTLPQPHTVERAEAPILDAVYRALLANLPLLPAQWRALQCRGLHDQDIVRRQYRTLPRQGRAALARRLVAQFGADICARVPGLYIAERDGRRWWSLAGAAGLLISVRDMEGHIIALKVRADDAADGPRYTTISSAKHGGASPGALVHVPLHGQRGGTVRVTEGELKADVATTLSGMLTLSIPGMSCWRAALPILERLHPQEVRLAFDRDWRVKPPVADALTGVAFALMRAPYRVTMDDWYEQPEKGIDDLLAAGKTPVVKSAALALSARDRVHAQYGKGRGLWHA